MTVSRTIRPLILGLGLVFSAASTAQDAVTATPQAPTPEQMQAALEELTDMGIRCAAMYQQVTAAASDGRLQAAGFESPDANSYDQQRDFWREFLLYISSDDGTVLDPVLQAGSDSFAVFFDDLADPENTEREAMRMEFSNFMNQCSQVRANVVEPMLMAEAARIQAAEQAQPAE